MNFSKDMKTNFDAAQSRGCRTKNKFCKKMTPIFTTEKYKEYTDMEVRELTPKEIEKYMPGGSIILMTHYGSREE